MSYAQRILEVGTATQVEAGIGSNTIGLAVKGDAEALKRLPDILRQRATDAERQLSGAATAIESAMKKNLVKMAVAEAKKIQSIVKALEG